MPKWTEWRWVFHGSAGQWVLMDGDEIVPIGGPPSVDPTKGAMGLTAAAPELYEALNNLIAPNGGVYGTPDLIEAARAALAKARGDG